MSNEDLNGANTVVSGGDTCGLPSGSCAAINQCLWILYQWTGGTLARLRY